jgi:hypothetical protein
MPPDGAYPSSALIDWFWTDPILCRASEVRGPRFLPEGSGYLSGSRPVGCERRGAQSMAKSGETCETAGIWRSTCPDSLLLALVTGEMFPYCEEHGQISWVLDRVTNG